MSSPGALVDDRGETITVVAAADGNIASKVPSSARNVYVSAFVNDANDWVLLPKGSKGQRISGFSVPAHEMRTAASSNIKINGVDSDSSQEAAIPATTRWELHYVNDTIGWILETQTELGVDIAGIVPD